MNSIAESVAASMPREWRITERHVFVFMAAWFFVLTLAGFVPSSLAKIQAVQAGQRPPFPIILHVHAVMMGAWLVLLLAQSALAASGRRAVHRVLGFAGALLLPAIVVSGVMLIDTTWQGLWSPAAAAAMPAQLLEETRTFVSNILLLQGRALVLLPVFVGWALWIRKRDPESHRRLMILGTAIPVVAGLDRLGTALGLTTVPASPLSLEISLYASVLPLLFWDLIRNGGVHRTTWIWIAVNLPLSVVTCILWNSSTWLTLAPRLAGVS